ncbi:hypothetical protein ACE6H2_019509 [Prunus campanulata]
MAEPLICSWMVFGNDCDEGIQIFFQCNDHIKAMMSTRTTRGVFLVKSRLRCLTCTTVECEAKVAMLNASSFFTSYIHLSQIFSN